LSRANPDWAPWLTAVESVLHALDQPPATTLAVRLPSARADGAPLLDGATITLDGKAATSWVERLFGNAADALPSGSGGAVHVGAEAALPLLEAAIERDLMSLCRYGGDVADGDAAGPVLALADLAVHPILQACRAELAPMAPDQWQHGHCPICGSWAALAELRGLERVRRLRCVRCGGDWQVRWLSCPFCGENDHRKLGSLTPEHGAETRRIDKCESCRAYVKTVTTLSATPPWSVLLDDAETVDLDVAAMDRGYARPPGGGRDVGVHLEAFP
jgi:FdhE protein